MSPLHCSIFGAGAWGTAMAIHLNRMGHAVTLVPRRLEQALALTRDRENKERLPGRALPPTIQIGFAEAPAMIDAEVIFLAAPSQGLRALARSLAPAVRARVEKPLCVTLCKGLEAGTLLPSAAVVAQELPEVAHAVLSGPSHADDVSAGNPTALVLACEPAAKEAFSELSAALSDAHLRIYLSTDVRGVELAGTLKNIYAVGAGLCDGMRLGDNAKAAYLTRCLSEMVKVGMCLGGKPETFYGLSGFGDLVATCTGPWSRNRTFGEHLLSGKTPDALVAAAGGVVEGYTATRAIHDLCQKEGLDAPILAGIYAVVYEGASPKAVVQALMMRDLKSED